MATTNLSNMGGAGESDPLTGDPQPHKPAEDTEQIYFEGSPMLRAEMAKGWYWVLIGLAVISIPIVWRVLHNPGAGDPFAWWWFLVAAVVGLILIFVPWLLTKTVKYKITNYRIDYERGLIGRKIDTLELWHVDDIALQQGVLERIIGVGTMTVMSGDRTTPRLAMRGLPNPKPLFESLKQRVIAVKRQRGVVKMDIS
jgi:membrane protein YdbS with pleckstrin-like domain